MLSPPPTFPSGYKVFLLSLSFKTVFKWSFSLLIPFHQSARKPLWSFNPDEPKCAYGVVNREFLIVCFGFFFI